MDKLFRLDQSRELVHFFGAPEIDFAEWSYAILDMVAEKEMPKGSDVLINTSFQCQSLRPEQVQRMESIIDLVCLRFGKKVALVNCSVGTCTLTQMVALKARSNACRAFMQETEAIEWLKGNGLKRVSQRTPGQS